MACRVLLAENTIRGLGGSYESLFVTASSLDRRRFEPVVLFFQPNHFAEKLAAQGVRVLIRRSRQFWEREGYIEKAAGVRSKLPRRGLLGSLRRGIVSLARTISGGLPMAWSVYRTLKNEHIDILHTNNNLQRDSMMVLAGALAGIPVVAHERQLSRCSWLAAWLSARVDILVCISDAVLEFSGTNGARVRDRRRVYNAIEAASVEGVRPLLPPGPKRVGIVGRIMPKKGQRYFIEAAALICREIPEVEFFVIGQATGEDKAYEAEAREVAQRLGLESRVRWTGHVNEPMGLMKSLDVIVHAAVEPEPFGRVIIEALALGRPMVATALGGPCEIIEDGLSGFLVPPADPSAIAEKVICLLRDTERIRRMGQAALRRAKDFGVAAYIRQIETVYEDVLIARGRGGCLSGAPTT